MFSVIEQVNLPGGTGTGDDRVGFDEARQTAWVIDGATDVADARLFEDGESDAAVYADLLCAAFQERPPADDEGAHTYITRILTAVTDQVRAKSTVDIASIPRFMNPSAAGLWVRQAGDYLEAAWLGDCVGFMAAPTGPLTLLGDPEKPEWETSVAREHHSQLDPATRQRWREEARASMNTGGDRGYWIFSVHPEAGAHVRTARVPVFAESALIMMTDGLYRLVEPYQLMGPEEILARGVSDGLTSLTSALRAFEDKRGPTTDRIKAKDDAAALLIRLADPA